MRVALAVCLPLLLISACKKAPEPPPPEAAASPEPVTQEQVSYSCDQQTIVQASYDNRDPAQPRADLLINGRLYKLYAIPGASGASYATEQGINPEQGMRWHTKGGNAFMETMTLDHTAKPEDESILFRCQQG